MKIYICLIGLVVIGCINPNQKSIETSSIIYLADDYYEKYLHHFPETAYFFGIELKDHNGLESKSGSFTLKSSKTGQCLSECLEVMLKNGLKVNPLNKMLRKKDIQPCRL